MTDHNLLTHSSKPGTTVEVQSTTQPDKFYNGIVGEDGIVRQERNKAAFSEDAYAVIGEIDDS